MARYHRPSDPISLAKSAHSILLGEIYVLTLPPVPACTLSCIQCCYQRNGTAPAKRRRFVEPRSVLADLRDIMVVGPRRSGVLISGIGEPTLFTGLPQIIRALASEPDFTLAIRTNGTLVGRRTVQRSLGRLSTIWLKLYAADKHTFATVCRPKRMNQFTRFRDGLMRLRDWFGNRVIVELSIIRTLNDTPRSIGALRTLLDMLEPDTVIADFTGFESESTAENPYYNDSLNSKTWRLVVLNELVRSTDAANGSIAQPMGSTGTSIELKYHLERKHCISQMLMRKGHLPVQP